MASDKDVLHMLSLGLESNITEQGISSNSVFAYYRGLQNINSSTPVLVLLHGYPQSSFMWRHVVPLLPKTIPLYIPDLPGYGRSAPLTVPHDKRNVGEAILSHLTTLIPANSPRQSIILAGHDRGGRVLHRLGVDQANYLKFHIRGTIIIDIDPTIVRWESFGNAEASTFGFHWGFLANVSLATSMIVAYGGAKFIHELLTRWAGKNEAGQTKFLEHDALNIYTSFFESESVVRATCDDYRAGAQEDLDVQREDQAAGRKLDVPVLLLYAQDFIGKRCNMIEVWSDWVTKKELLEEVSVGDGIGHFVPEEAPEQTAEAIVGFYKKISAA